MSADNAIAVKKVKDKWKVKMVFLSDDNYDKSRNFRDAEVFESEESALRRAFELEEKEYVEYGVIKL